tara:strand:- start:12047 stop:13213 length:1167 start_codon:yes stop_codon:yes gene_type:complete
MSFKDLLTKYRAGTVEETDLMDVSADDWMKVRLEGGEGLLNCALSTDALMGVTLAKAEDEEDDDKPKKKTGMSEKSFSYVMVSDGLIPPFNDRVEAKAWDLKQFNYRGGVILYDHNIEETRPPIGKGTNLQKGVELKRGGKSFKALTGDVTFADREIHPFAGMIEDLVQAKLLTNGSVGFDISKMRAPTTQEQEENGMKAYSAVIQKASLFEYSITPLGRDVNAQLLANEGVDPLEAKLIEFAQAGVHTDDVIGEFREGLLMGSGKATRSTFTMPAMPARHDQVFQGTWSTTAHTPEPLVSTFTISNDRPVSVTYVDSFAHNQIKELRAEVAELRDTLSALKRSRDEELYELLLGDPVEEVKTKPRSSVGSGDPLFDAALTLGFTPEP